MLKVIYEIYYKFRQLNRSRLEAKRLRKIIGDDIAPRDKHFPRNIKRILFVINKGGYGDAIYTAGLLRKLSDDGYIIYISVVSEKLHQFNHLSFLEVFNLNSVSDCNAVLDRNPDILIDLTWVGIKDWESRQYILTKAECFKVTTNYICDKLNIFDGFIDYRKVPHISERLALVREFITKSPSPPILPYIQISFEEEKRAQLFIGKVKDEGRKVLFLNGLAGQSRNCMSNNQVKTILGEVLNYHDIVVLLNEDIYSELNCDRTIKLPKTSFTEFCAILKRCDFIISVDTSVVHVASAYNKPIIAIFAPNIRDYYSQYGMGDVWGPISDFSITEKFDDSDLAVHKYGLVNRKARDMNTIPDNLLAERIKKDLENLLNSAAG